MNGPLVFGVYPGSALGDDVGGIVTGPPDRPDAINDALSELQGPAGRPFLEELIDAYTDRIATLQVCEEPNVTTNPALDGWYPRVNAAIIAGVGTAQAKARRDDLTDLKVGCNSTPLIGASAGFFAELTATGGERFIGDLDYIGLDFFPDVFRPIPHDRLGAIVDGLLTEHRHKNLVPAGLGHLPLVITEHGWPTGPGRPAERQAEVLRTVVETIAGHSTNQHNVAGYIHFTLRDACSARPDLFSQFGLMTDDYTPKPAFHVYRDLIETLTNADI